MISCPRSTSKAQWKKLYRLYRVMIREANKAASDMMIFGTGFMCFKYNKDPEYIPAHKVRIEP